MNTCKDLRTSTIRYEISIQVRVKLGGQAMYKCLKTDT